MKLTPANILEQVRQLLVEYAEGDPDRWFYANRFVFARLALDERRTKTAIKTRLLNDGVSCHRCGKPFEASKNIHLHRLDGNRGYSDANCVLMHEKCHQAWHCENERDAGQEGPPASGDAVLTKESKRYVGKPFVYWWDISPRLVQALEQYEAVEFVKKDSRERCCLPVEALKPFLTPGRQTTRGDGNWGIKVLCDRESELALEPGNRQGEWLFVPVIWLGDIE